MDKILNLNNVDLYNQIYGLETLHPLVTVIDLNKATRQMTYTHWNYGVYALYLKLAYIIHSGFISGYQNRYGDNLKPPTNVYHRMTA